MLKKFSVENFKGFKDKITLDIGTPGNYGFHKEVLDEACITKGIIYGINGSGKSNLGLAIFDVITHLTEKQKLLQSYDFYLNMSGRKSFAEFEYTFAFDGHELVYRYLYRNHVASLVFCFNAVHGKVVGAVALCHPYKGLHVACAVFCENAVLRCKFLVAGFPVYNVHNHEGAGGRQTLDVVCQLVWGGLHVRQRTQFTVLCIDRKKAT